MLEKIREFLRSENGESVQTCIVLVAGIILAGFVVCQYHNRDRAGNTTDSTIQSISTEQQHAVSEIDKAREASASAQNSISAASKGIASVQNRIERGAGLANENARAISNLADGLSECRKLAEENRSILNSITKADK